MALQKSGRSSLFPMYRTMRRLPGGMMIVPLLLGVLMNNLFPEALAIGSFTTALFRDGTLVLIGLLIVATGAQITGSSNGRSAIGTTLVVFMAKTIVPIIAIIILGFGVGIEGMFGVSILALLAIFGNSNGGLWLAFASQYGDARDQGAYVASAFDDGPFLALLFLGVSGLANIPLMAMLAAVIPFFIGLFIGWVDKEWTAALGNVSSIVIPFMAFAVGTGISLSEVLTGGAAGIVLGIGVVLLAGGFTYLGYRFVLRRGNQSGIGFAGGTTAGNAVAVPAAVAATDPTFQSLVGAASAQAATAVLVTAILAPLVAGWVLRREGGISNGNAEDFQASLANTYND